MKETNSIKIEFLSRSVNEGLARAAVGVFVSQLDPTLDELGDIKTAVSEAVTNCVVHAYPDCLGKITIKAQIFDDNSVGIEIIDHGVGIEDIDKAREPLFTTGNDERSGMGFSIMESFMDQVRVRSKPGRGTTVIMRRRISRRSTGK